LFDLILSLLLYFILPSFLFQYAGGGEISSLLFAGPHIGSQSSIQSLPIGILLFSLPFYLEGFVVILSLIALFASFFSLRGGIIVLSLFGFLAIVASAYSWILSYFAVQVSQYAIIMVVGLTVALIVYNAQLRYTKHRLSIVI
jgi:hypothetical protein